jgi:hypothetical protein
VTTVCNKTGDPAPDKIFYRGGSIATRSDTAEHQPDFDRSKQYLVIVTKIDALGGYYLAGGSLSVAVFDHAQETIRSDLGEVFALPSAHERCP